MAQALGAAAHVGLFETALGRLTQLLPQAERTMVVVEDQDELVAAAVKYIEKDFRQHTSAELLHRTLRRNKATLLLDAQQDQTYGHHPEVAKHQLRSVLCVPFELDDSTRGLLYADNRSQPAAFTYDDLHAAQKLAKQLGSGRLPSVAPAAPQPDDNVPVHPPALWIHGVTLTFALVVLLSLVVTPPGVTVKADQPRQEVVEVKPPDLGQRPFGLAKTLLEHLRSKNFQAAHQLVDQSSVTLSDLERAHASWMNQEGPEGVAQRQVATEKILGDLAVVEVARQGVVDAPTWTWHFTRRGDTWRLSRPEGPPFD